MLIGTMAHIITVWPQSIYASETQSWKQLALGLQKAQKARVGAKAGNS